MIVSVHQPNYLPWLGYFHKIAHSDIFVFLDTVQYPRGSSVANRNRIKTAHGVQYLTVPVSVPKGRRGKASYLEVSSAGGHWVNTHVKTLQMAYGRAPYFERYIEDVVAILERAEPFVEMNVALIHFFLSQLSISTPVYRLSRLDIDPGRKSHLILDICQHFEAGVYLSGQGARKYNDEALYNANGIQLVYQDFTCPRYTQLFGEFVPNLSIVDLLFNCGPQSKDVLLES
jgi:hypothetical protein